MLGRRSCRSGLPEKDRLSAEYSTLEMNFVHFSGSAGIFAVWSRAIIVVFFGQVLHEALHGVSKRSSARFRRWQTSTFRWIGNRDRLPKATQTKLHGDRDDHRRKDAANDTLDQIYVLTA